MSRSRLSRARSLSSSVSDCVGKVPRTVCAVIGARGCRSVVVAIFVVGGTSISDTLTGRGAPKGCRFAAPRDLLFCSGLVPAQSKANVCDVLSKKRRNSYNLLSVKFIHM